MFYLYCQHCVGGVRHGHNVADLALHQLIHGVKRRRFCRRGAFAPELLQVLIKRLESIGTRAREGRQVSGALLLGVTSPTEGKNSDTHFSDSPPCSNLTCLYSATNKHASYSDNNLLSLLANVSYPSSMSTANDAHALGTQEFVANMFLPDTCSFPPPRLRSSKGRRGPDRHQEAPVCFRPALATCFEQARMGKGEDEILQAHRRHSK